MSQGWRLWVGEEVSRRLPHGIEWQSPYAHAALCPLPTAQSPMPSHLMPMLAHAHWEAAIRLPVLWGC